MGQTGGACELIFPPIVPHSEWSEELGEQGRVGFLDVLKLFAMHLTAHLLEDTGAFVGKGSSTFQRSQDIKKFKGGKMVPVNKADWDKPGNLDRIMNFTHAWLRECRRVLYPDGTIWVSGTHHNVFQVGYVMQALGFHILNEIVWFKSNAPPNLGCRCFTHSHESLVWARRSKEGKHYFNYPAMKMWDDRFGPEGKQMRSVWGIPLTPRREKKQAGILPKSRWNC